MRVISRLILVFVFFLLVTGCYISRKGEICSITMPQAYCDREAYDRLTKPGTAMEDWSISGRTEDMRLMDWKKCGGADKGYYGLEPLLNGQERTAEQERRESGILFRQIQRCMLKKNYQYIGKCYDNEISRSHPACGAP